MTAPCRCSLRLITIAAVISILSTFGWSVNYVQTEAILTGNEIHTFEEAGQNVAVVLGDFSLELIGERTIVARDAVVWISSQPSGATERHDITVYAEGGATLIDSDGTERSAEKIIVTFYCEGRFTAEGLLTDRPLANFPLYVRAKQARTAPRPRPVAPTPVAPRPQAPTPIENIVDEPVDETTAVDDDNAIFIQPTETHEPAETPKPVEPEVELIPQPVAFSADEGSSEMTETGRISIAKGNVYFSIGGPDSAEFIELRSDAAVIFSKPGAKKKADLRFPLSTDLQGFGAQDESVTGVYLEGDVTIARGERFFRAPAAYYDLVTDRAIILDPVFRSVQKQRNVPLYIRAREARMLSAREMWFADAQVTTSDFYTPSYAMASRSAYIEDRTPYDELGKKIGEQKWYGRMRHATFRVRDVPLFYLPRTQGSLEQGNTALRKVSMGKSGGFGWGVQTQWHLFRLLGLVKPSGVKGIVNFDVQERGVVGGIDLEYARDKFSGYHMAYAVYDDDGTDDFGTERENIEAPTERGRLLIRHKQILPRDWQLQFELSYICDRNFMEEYFPNEFFAGKEQETLLYVKKQKDNWAFTSLVQYRINRFLTQTESYPELELYLLGEPLWGDRLLFFHESRVGAKRFRPANFTKFDDSDTFGRFDIRDELQMPLKLGAVRVTPYAVGRATYWTDEPDWFNNGRWPSENCRPYGQVGVRTSTDFWRIFPGVESRLWDVHGLKHIITPELTGFLASSHGVYPFELFPMDQDIEGIERTSGTAFNIYQRLQTKRGVGADKQTVDWMRMNLSIGSYSNNRDNTRSDGRFFGYRPENSIDRNHVNGEYFWNISDSTALVAKANYDIDDEQLGTGSIGFAVQRSPRLSYLAGCRYIDDADSAVGTFGVNYKINKKYSVSAFEQYDFAFRDGRNLSSTIAITRKWPRWYSSFVFSYDNSNNEATLLINFWPEGMPEVSIGGAKLGLLGSSSRN